MHCAVCTAEPGDQSWCMQHALPRHLGGVGLCWPTMCWIGCGLIRLYPSSHSVKQHTVKGNVQDKVAAESCTWNFWDVPCKRGVHIGVSAQVSRTDAMHVCRQLLHAGCLTSLSIFMHMSTCGMCLVLEHRAEAARLTQGSGGLWARCYVDLYLVLVCRCPVMMSCHSCQHLAVVGCCFCMNTCVPWHDRPAALVAGMIGAGWRTAQWHADVHVVVVVGGAH